MTICRVLLTTMLACAAPAALAQPISCQIPPSAIAPPPAVPDGPTRLLPITNYVLALSWAPDFCDIHAGDADAARECNGRTARFGFVLHGLWPDAAHETWPQWCPARPPATRQVPAAIVRQMACTTPSPTLLAHEWAKHGTCMAASPQAYFAQSSALFNAIRYPDMAALARRAHLTAGDLRTAFAAANPRYPREAIGLLTREATALQEIHFCLDRTMHPAPCVSKTPPDSAEIRITPPPPR
jgi:ribonuclease T2